MASQDLASTYAALILADEQQEITVSMRWSERVSDESDGNLLGWTGTRRKTSKKGQTGA